MTDKIEHLLELLSLHGGVIVCSASCDHEEIRQARASGRMFVDENNIGYIWNPCIKEMPTNEKEVEFFEKWYPLDIEVDENFYENMLERIFNTIRNGK